MKISKLIIIALTVFSFAAGLYTSTPAAASLDCEQYKVSDGSWKVGVTIPTACKISAGSDKAGGNNTSCTDADGKPVECTLERTIANIVGVLLFIIGTLAVIMLIIGGIRYTTSNGNPEQIKAAKNTLMYAVIGLIVALLAFAIVNFVVSSL
ncbi:hypothetical protein H6796_03245 [Candidatus Nomurabacteria bacterium]|nr:hypothetical protein [Candidatus Nomurabacteria bacterium]